MRVCLKRATLIVFTQGECGRYYMMWKDVDEEVGRKNSVGVDAGMKRRAHVHNNIL